VWASLGTAPLGDAAELSKKRRKHLEEKKATEYRVFASEIGYRGKGAQAKSSVGGRLASVTYRGVMSAQGIPTIMVRRVPRLG